MGTISDGIDTYFTTWAGRSGTVAGISTSAPDEKTPAIAVGAARAVAKFGDDVDDTDPLAVAYGFLEAVRFLRVHTTIEVSQSDEKWLKEIKEWVKDIWMERFQEEWEPYQKVKEDTDIDKLFPYT